VQSNTSVLFHAEVVLDQHLLEVSHAIVRNAEHDILRGGEPELATKVLDQLAQLGSQWIVWKIRNTPYTDVILRRVRHKKQTTYYISEHRQTDREANRQV
jgi:hypothetical protein